MPQPGNPGGLNRYSYVLNNPLRYRDPSGHAECVDESCDIVFEPHQRRLIPRGRGAARWYYQSGLEMVSDWLTESGPQTRYYGASAPMTRDLRRDEGVQQAREHFYSTGETSYRYRFTDPKQPIREGIQWVDQEDRIGIGSILGSYGVYIQNNGDRTITIWVHNIVSRESGTRLLGKAPSIEDLVASGEITSYATALVNELQKYSAGEGSLQDVRKVWPVSILNSTNRGEPSSTGIVPGVWGGNMATWFMWTEALCTDCN